VAPNGEVIGACLNGCHEPGHAELMEAEAGRCPNPKFRKILQLLATLERRSDVFGKFPDVTRLLEIRIVAVDGAWRGKGIATALLERTESVVLWYTNVIKQSHSREDRICSANQSTCLILNPKIHHRVQEIPPCSKTDASNPHPLPTYFLLGPF